MELSVSILASKDRKESIEITSEDEFAIDVLQNPIKIYYGNQYNQVQDTIIYSAPKINDFTCYRNVPCHNKFLSAYGTHLSFLR